MTIYRKMSETEEQFQRRKKRFEEEQQTTRDDSDEIGALSLGLIIAEELLNDYHGDGGGGSIDSMDFVSDSFSSGGGDFGGGGSDSGW